MADTSRAKCSECVRAGRPCVNMSWASLDKTREEISEKISSDEVLLATVMTRLLRNNKILKEIDAKAKRKPQCLLSEMESAGTLEDADCPAADALVELSPAMWSSLAMLDDYSNVGGTAVSSSGRFLRCFSGSHVFSDVGYPFHFTKYF